MNNAFETDTLNILEPDTLKFSRDDSGFLNLEYQNETYKKVSLTRLVPFDDDESYISVNFTDDHDDWKEIGVIVKVSELSDENAGVVRDYLAFKYYIPGIIEISKITDNRRGYLFLEANTTAGEKKIAVNDWWHNFRMITATNTLSITDADGNRYVIPDVDKLDKASMKRLQLFI